MELANFRARAQGVLAQEVKCGELIQRVAVGPRFWLITARLQPPSVVDGAGGALRWQTPRYYILMHNPVYAGADAYGRRRTQVRVSEGREQVSRIKRCAPAGWRVLITDHRTGYIDWTKVWPTRLRAPQDGQPGGHCTFLGKRSSNWRQERSAGNRYQLPVLRLGAGHLTEWQCT